MDRPSRDDIFIEVSHVFSKRASCLRGSVGALLTFNNRIISTGYNGPVRGAETCHSDICDLSKPCQRSIHAELNAILAAARAGICTEGSHLYCTTAPCLDCARAIIQAGITRVVYSQNFRDDRGLKLLGEYNIPIKQIEWPKAN